MGWRLLLGKFPRDLKPKLPRSVALAVAVSPTVMVFSILFPDWGLNSFHGHGPINEATTGSEIDYKILPRSNLEEHQERFRA